MNYRRKEYYLLEERMRPNGPNRIQMVLGPRQVGKTTLVLQWLRTVQEPNNLRYFTGDAQIGGSWIEGAWNAARIASRADQATQYLVLDEIQKTTRWSEVVKRLWDEDRAQGVDVRVVLLGSAQLLLDKGLTESLAGRSERIHLSHWRFNEMNEAFGLSAEEYVWFGGYPGAMDYWTDESRWKAYVRESLVETAITQDVLMMHRVLKPALLRQTFEMALHYAGQTLSINKMVGQLQDAGNTTTLSEYLNLLNQARLIAPLHKYAGAYVRKRASSPTFHLYNPAIRNAYRPGGRLDLRNAPSLWGRAVEIAVGAHLLSYQSPEFEVTTWREGDFEVDFVVKTPRGLFALEVKSGRDKASGLTRFQEQFNPTRTLLVGPGGIPWQDFLRLEPADWAV